MLKGPVKLQKYQQVLTILARVIFAALLIALIAAFASATFAASRAEELVDWAVLVRNGVNGVIISLALLMVAVGGVQYIIASDSGGVGEARTTIIYALSGLAFWFLGCALISGCLSGGTVLDTVINTLRQG